MIVSMKKGTTKQEYQKVIDFLKAKNLEVKDVSSDSVIVFGILGDTSLLDPRDLTVFPGIAEVTRVSVPYKKASRQFKKEDTVVKISEDISIGDSSFVMMAGPCSVESMEQLDIIAKGVKEAGGKILRAGAFKPRTSPYAFQGLEVEGLKMLKEINKKYGLLIVTEIPSPDLLPLFEEYVDIIQVGARNMQNFHLLKALGKTNKPILLKRGASATVEEWLMSAEYILAGGNENVILCERGIRTYEKYTRNTLDISAVLAVKELSHLPVIVDPSHAAGRWTMIENLSLAAFAVGADGLIVEVHNNPEFALSDGAQSLKISKYHEMVKKLKKLETALDRKLV